MNYFDKLPTLTYNNYLAKNLLARARLSDQIKSVKTAFLPYEIEEGDRIDLLSNLYYDDPGYSWLIWLTNNSIDPYYDQPLDVNDFVDFIQQKYGSYAKASRKILYYRNNWYDNTSASITPAAFNSLGNSTQKYYEPVLNNTRQVVKYIRKRDDDKLQTNKIITFNISSVTGTFTVGEEVQTNGTNYAFVTFANSSVMTCQHVTGALSGTITGQESAATATVSSVTTITQTLAATEANFWTAVSYLDHEQELNEAKKAIKLLDIRYRNQAEEDLRRIMKAR